MELNGEKYQGKAYQSASGGITPAILADAIKTVWAPCFVGRSADKVVGVLCDAYGHHWDVEVLEAMISLDGQPPLLTGMRVDVFFKNEGPAT